MDDNPLAAFPWLHLAAALTGLGLRLFCGAFILALAFKALWLGNWHWRHWSTRVLAYLGLGILLLTLSVAVISVTYSWLSQREG